MSSRLARGRAGGATVAAVLVLAASVLWPAATSPPDRRPNVIIVLTDDQPADSIDAMPWLHAELARPGSGWFTIPNAFANTPLCCPARASLLTGRYARHTGVLDNDDGARLDEASTLATWLHDAGYRTGLVGKYLNGFPFGRPPYVPPGWDRFVAKRNDSGATVYVDFHAIDQGSPVFVRAYATDWLAERAVRFVETSPPDRPFFLLFTPSAPHPPWIPAARHAGAYVNEPVAEPPNVAGALRGAPPWVRALPAPSAAQRAEWLAKRRRADETLLAVDESIRSIVEALGDRLDDTVIFVLSDNGYSFGEHRWEGKKCPYAACTRIPFAVRSPWAAGADTRPPVVSIVDLAPTIVALAGVTPRSNVDGVPFAGWIRPRPGMPAEPFNDHALLEWSGDGDVPAWTAVRTADLTLIRYADGREDLYDLGGRRGSPDPWEMDNRADDPRYTADLSRLRRLLGR